MNQIDLEIRTRDFPALDKKVENGTATELEIARHQEMLDLFQRKAGRDKRSSFITSLVMAMIVLGLGFWMLTRTIDAKVFQTPDFGLVILFFALIPVVAVILAMSERLGLISHGGQRRDDSVDDGDDQCGN